MAILIAIILACATLTTPVVVTISANF